MRENTDTLTHSPLTPVTRQQQHPATSAASVPSHVTLQCVLAECHSHSLLCVECDCSAMSNTFTPLADLVSDDDDRGSGSGSDNDSGSSEDSYDDEKQLGNGHAPSSLRLRLQTATEQLAFRHPQHVFVALQLLEALLADCAPHDSGIIIQCYAHRGTAHMLLALLTCRDEQYAHTLTHYDQAIDGLITAMQLCHATTMTDSSGEVDTEVIDLDRDQAVYAIGMDLEHTTQLRQQVVSAEARKQAMLERSNEERDKVKAGMGDTKWKRQTGNSHFADKRRQLVEQLKELRAVLQKIDDTQHERERLETFEAQQKVVMRQRKETAKRQKEQRVQKRPDSDEQLAKKRVWRRKQ